MEKCDLNVQQQFISNIAPQNWPLPSRLSLEVSGELKSTGLHRRQSLPGIMEQHGDADNGLWLQWVGAPKETGDGRSKALCVWFLSQTNRAGKIEWEGWGARVTLRGWKTNWKMLNAAVIVDPNEDGNLRRWEAVFPCRERDGRQCSPVTEPSVLLTPNSASVWRDRVFCRERALSNKQADWKTGVLLFY